MRRTRRNSEILENILKSNIFRRLAVIRISDDLLWPAGYREAGAEETHV
jgi:hypothetical protein